MFTTSAASAPVPASPPAPAPSTSRRLRGLSYLRSYTSSHLSSHSNQNHSSRSQRQSLSRTTSCPSQPDRPAEISTSPREIQRRPHNHSNNPSDSSDSQASSSHQPAGWMSTPDEQNHLTRRRTEPQHSPGALSVTPNVDNPLPSTNRDMSPPRTTSRARRLRNLGATIIRGDGATSAEEPTMNEPASSLEEHSSIQNRTEEERPHQLPKIRFIPHQDPRSTRPSLTFHTISRTLPDETQVIRVGRYSERDAYPSPAPNQPSTAPVGFKSKVVSRKHCEFWCQNGQWYIKDVKSSSGTFLNHIRLSQPNVESRPWPINDGDVVQLGIDFRGGEEMIFRCVKMRIECNRGWQMSLNSFNTAAHKRLRDLAKSSSAQDDTASTHGLECSICLGSIAPCQSLFVAPCSHAWHYKCIRPILNDDSKYPNFLCPNCRAVADLEADVDVPEEEEDIWEKYELEANREEEIHITPTESSHSSVEPSTSVTATPTVQPAPSQSDGRDDTVLITLAENVSLEQNSSASQDSNETPTPISQSSLFARRQAAQAGNSSHVNGTATVGSIDVRTSSAPISNSIAEPTTELEASSSNDVLRSTTPVSNDVVPPDAPMTPTNDAGPFVIDGSAGRASGERIAANIAAVSGSPEPRSPN
ncbi:MAG: hypothetical protein M1834_005442 [Cirrosporium novae-zelandiae]|nr:MAG: hypothetical protein M1834_005442 [Cirrosporium novae-zelandiae]